MSKKIRWGVLCGGGDSLIGVLHRVAASMFDAYALTGAVFNPDYALNNAFAEEIGLPLDQIYQDFDTMVAEELKRPKD